MLCSASKNVWAQRVSTKRWMIIIIARHLANRLIAMCLPYSNVQYLISSPSAHRILLSLEKYKLQTSLALQLVISWYFKKFTIVNLVNRDTYLYMYSYNWLHTKQIDSNNYAYSQNRLIKLSSSNEKEMFYSAIYWYYQNIKRLFGAVCLWLLWLLT